MQNINALERRFTDDPALLVALLADPVACLRSVGVDVSNSHALEIAKAMSLASCLCRTQDLEVLTVAVSAA